MKRLIVYLLAAILLLSQMAVVSHAEDIRKSGLFSYTLKGNGTAIIVGFDDDANGNRDVYVPAQIDGYTVSEIGAKAFQGVDCECVLMLPDTITTIGEAAFYKSAFTSVPIPASVKVIGGNAFNHMENVKKMSVDSQNPVFATIDGNLYNKQTKALIAVPFRRNSRFGDSIDFTIPDGIREIGEGVFRECGHMRVTLPDSIEKIGAHAFESSAVLESEIYLPANLKELGEAAFYSASSRYVNRDFCSISLYDTQLTEIPASAFEFIDLDSFDFWYISLPKTLTKIGNRAFARVDFSTAGFSLPINVVSIGNEAFTRGKGRFVIPDNSKLQEIGERAFYGFDFEYPTLNEVSTTITLPYSLQRIGKEAFLDINGVDTIVIPASVTYIGENFCNRAAITLDVQPGSYAEFWASENGYNTTLDSSEEDTSWLFE